MFDMAFFHEKLAHNTFINCNYETMIRTIKKWAATSNIKLDISL
jgi:hypothetical protein